MTQPVRKPKTQKLPKGATGKAFRGTKLSTANPGSKPARRIRGRLTDSARFR